MPRNLILAYLVTWTIHAGYIASLVRKWRRLKQEQVTDSAARVPRA